MTLGGGLLAASFVLNMALAQSAARPLVPSDRVVGGTVAADRAWPWQVGLFFRRPNGAFVLGCGGTLISRNWVLSAAHCFGSRGPNDVVVVESSNRIENPLKERSVVGRRIRVRRIILHEQYDRPRSENDIALVELVAPAKSSAVPLATPRGHDFEAVGRNSVITGWGTIRAMNIVNNQVVDVQTERPVRPGDPAYFTEQLMEAQIPLVDQGTCRAAYPSSSKVIDERTLCAGLKQGGKDSCQGDSGGPLVTANERGGFVQIGIVSWGRSCGLPNSYGIYTRVSAYDAWIRSKTGTQEPVVVAAAPVPVSSPPVSSAPAAPAAPAAPDSAAVPTPLALPPDILAHANSAGVIVELHSGDAIRVGQSAQFRVSVQRPGYLVLLDLTPDGRLTQIYPNALSLAGPTGTRRTNLIEADHPLLIPDPRNPYEGFEMKVEPPAGAGMLVAVLSDQPLTSITAPPQPRTMERGAAIDFLSSLAGELNRDLLVDGVSQPRTWSVALKPYRVEP